jgi:hypothetical protein
MVDPTKMLGRKFAPDARDLMHPVRAMLAAPEQPPVHKVRHWERNARWWGDQGQTPPSFDGDHPYCVEFAWNHWLAAGPLCQEPIRPQLTLYAAAQDRDEWDGPPPPYDGTSVRAGAKALQELGRITAYKWAETIGDIALTLADVGPMVLGTNWYEGMMETGPGGLVEPTGALVGGHAYLVDGIDLRSGVARIKQSWGREWGLGGYALITLVSLERLLREDGEACIAIEARAA